MEAVRAGRLLDTEGTAMESKAAERLRQLAGGDPELQRDVPRRGQNGVSQRAGARPLEKKDKSNYRGATTATRKERDDGSSESGRV